MEGPPRRRPVQRIVWAVLAVMVLIPAIVFVDAHRRARQAVDRFERESKPRFDAFLSQEFFRPPVFDDPLPGNAWELYDGVFEAMKADLGNSTSFDPILLSHTYLRTLNRALRMRATASAARWATPGEGADLTSEILGRAIPELIAAHRDRDALGVLQTRFGLDMDLARHAQISDAAVCFRRFLDGIGRAKGLLEAHALAASDFREFLRALDRLDGSRPSMLAAWEVMEGVGPYLSLLFLNTPHVDRLIEPTWRNLGSRTLARAQAFGELAAFFEHQTGVGRRPVHLRAERDWLIHGSYGFRLARFTVCRGVDDSYTLEVMFLRDWTLLRLATALAWFEREKGAFPEKLSDLVPRYISEVPERLPDGSPFRYTAGRIERGEGKHEIVWTVRRR